MGDRGDRVGRLGAADGGRFLRVLLLWLTDYLAILLAECLAFFLRRDFLPIADPDFFIPPVYLYVVVPTIFLFFLHVTSAHIRSVPLWRMIQTVFWAVVYSLLTIVMLMYVGHVANFVSRLFVGMTGLFTFFLVIGARYGLKKGLHALRLFRQPVIFVGAGKTAEIFFRAFDSSDGFGYRVVGFVDDHPTSTALAQRFPCLGGFDDAVRIVREKQVDTVLIIAPGLSSAQQVALVNDLQPHVRSVKFIPDLIGTPIGNISVEGIAETKLMFLTVQNNLAIWYNRFFKRLFDLLLSFCGLVVLLPLCLAVAIAIRIDSPGPILFAHRRVGRGGREFPCYKFRTMVPDAEAVLERYLVEYPKLREEWEKEYKLKGDPRVTRVGAFLRRTSLDELPQFFNVLTGEMSLVGPRPIVVKEIPKYGDAFQDFCLVRPGITGIWQVNGRSDTTYDERVAMDSWYVRNWSIWIDLFYLLKTVKVVLSGRGAY